MVGLSEMKLWLYQIVLVPKSINDKYAGLLLSEVGRLINYLIRCHVLNDTHFLCLTVYADCEICRSALCGCKIL